MRLVQRYRTSWTTLRRKQSQTLNGSEKNFAQIDKEGLAVVNGVKKFHLSDRSQNPLRTIRGNENNTIIRTNSEMGIEIISI